MTLMAFPRSWVQRSRPQKILSDKQLGYHRETVLQGGSVLAKSGRGYSADNIGLQPL